MKSSMLWSFGTVARSLTRKQSMMLQLNLLGLSVSKIKVMNSYVRQALEKMTQHMNSTQRNAK